MLKKILLNISLLVSVISTYSQQYGNEWIDYNQTYYKFYITSDGIYRISYSTLINTGIPLASIDPRSIQIFHNGEEEYIYIEGESDGIFNSADFIEIYCTKNDGWLDTQLYDYPSSQANPNYSLFSDSAAYFITWNSSINNRRLVSETDVSYSSYTASTWFYKVIRQDYASKYYNGAADINGVTDADYTAGEGWFNGAFSLGGSITKTLSTSNIYSSGTFAYIDYVIVGASNSTSASPDHHLKVTMSGTTLVDTLYEGYGVFRFHSTISASLMNSTSNFVFSSINDLGSSADRNALSWINLRYPHTTNLENLTTFKLWIPDAVQAKTYLNLTNFNASAGDNIRFYDLSNQKRILTTWDGSSVKVLIPNSGSLKECYMTSDAQIKSVTKLYSVGTSAKFTNYKTLANSIFADYYIITHSSLMAEVEDYKTYRNSTGFSTLVIDVDNLWDQYSYGVLKHSLAIKNFMRCAYETYDIIPKYLFIIGKGYKAGADGGPIYRNNAYYFEKTLIPAIGNPPSDILYTAGILDTLYQPAVPTGRLAARTPDHVSLYLDKVILYEMALQTNEEWMKSILHFCGGKNSAEQQVLCDYLETYEDLIEGYYYGGNVMTFKKNSTEPFQTNFSDSLKGIINNGVALITFFGHAAGSGFDQGIDGPQEYNNYGKYPMILANSCFAGDLYNDSTVTAEDFVLIEDKGAIGFIASPSLSVSPFLHMYSNEFYTNMGVTNYGSSVGILMQNTVKNIQTPMLYVKESCLGMNLHGDPAIKMPSFDKPDYMVNSANVYFEPSVITSEIDTFIINVVSTNIGKAINDNFFVSVVRTYPDGTTEEPVLYFTPATYYKDTISFEIPVNITKGVGLNVFTVTLDYYDNIDEMSEVNNSADISLLIKTLDIIPVWPHKYAIVQSLPTLKASTGYAFADPSDYIFELDTNDQFNSALKQQYKINHEGGVIEWTPTYPITTDSIVYFWRVSVDSAVTGEYNWKESSFEYISGKHGWGQSHFHQFKEDEYEYVTYSRPDGKFNFTNNKLSITCNTGIYPSIQWFDEWYKINGVYKYTWAYLGTGGNGMIVAVFDQVSGEPYSRLVESKTEYAFEFSTITDSLVGVMADFINSVPAGDYILAYSHRNHNAENWTEAAYQAFESFGSSTIRTLLNNRPYIIFGQKGDAIGTANELAGSQQNSVIYLQDSINTNWQTGYVESELIGPASSWKSLHWRTHFEEFPSSDSIRLTVIGINQAGEEVELRTNILRDETDIYDLNVWIDSSEYHYLKLKAYISDNVDYTPEQIDSWRLLYEGVPETALDPSYCFYLYDDTIQQGDYLKFATATHNISEYDMDSLLIKYWILDHERNIQNIGSFRCEQHPSGDILIDTVVVATNDLVNANSLWIEVNPDNDQLEMYHFNNIGEVYFFVKSDKINPLLDVTFDGVHILDGDIVSAKPEIVITVKDENQYLALDDTSEFEVYLVQPGSNVYQPVYFYQNGLEKMQFNEASLPENRAQIIYNPDFSEDGTYHLKVLAKDKSNNESGDNAYEVSFEVVNKSTITSVMNWPNPFSTSTHFVFTLTGSELPTFFMIQIMTISGKVVREIMLDELGPIHIGRNITEYAWDGTDMYGDRLANGIYLYRVITKIDDSEIEKMETSADQYFVKDFGKMYLIR